MWTCSECTLENASEATQCSVCKNNRPLQMDQWSCKACTWTNAMSDKACVICETPAPVMTPVKKSAPSWSCLSCTFLNPATRTACLACKQEQPKKTSGKEESSYTINEQAWSDSKCVQYYQDYRFVCSNVRDDDVARVRLHEIIRGLYTQLDVHVAQKTGGGEANECQACYEPLGDHNRFVMSACGHTSLCKDCVARHLRAKISEDQVTPWLRCPHPKCSLPIDANDLAQMDQALTVTQWSQFAATILRCHLARNQHFRVCPTTKCRFGFLIFQDKVAETCKCASCHQTHQIKLNDLSPEFVKMIDDGTMRKCPRCNQLTLKERGICNVINCSGCGVWWNWQTRDTGKDEATLKNKARAQGSLWETGELEYQRSLEKKDPVAFRQLLERNGMVYKQNYIRGT